MSDEVTKTSPFSVLPESCIAHIISLMSPKYACQLATVSAEFKSAADSDAVWQRFLPPSCNEILSRASSPVTFKTKKQLCLLLLQSNLLLDEGKMSFKLNKFGTSFTMSARALHIAEIDNPRHWKWLRTSEPRSMYLTSKFAEVATLRSIHRLNIRGILPSRMLSPNTRYRVWFYYSFTVSRGGKEFAGLDLPSKASIKFVKKDGTEIEVENNIIYLEEPRNRTYDGTFVGRLSWALGGYWYGIEMGDFFIGDDDGDNFDIHVEVSQLNSLNEKRGLVIEGIEIDAIRFRSRSEYM